MKFCPKKAKEYQEGLGFVRDGTHRCNISYHLQYLEFCYQIKRDYAPESTTESLLNKTIIIELGAIVEVILDDLLGRLKIDREALGLSGDMKIVVPHYATLRNYLELARDYRIIEKDMFEHLGKLSEARNTVHFKKFKKSRELEYNYYTQELLSDVIGYFEKFFEFIEKKYGGDSTVARHWKFPWQS